MGKVVSFVDVMHSIEKLVFLASYIKADAIDRVVPTLVLAMQPPNDASLSLKLVVSITNKEHSTREKMKMRVGFQLSFKLLIY